MSVEHDVSAHYTRGVLEKKILNALRAAGKDLDNLRSQDLAVLDNLHVGGQQATEDLADSMELAPGVHLLDVGCGIGGPARYLAERGYRVTGMDLTDEFVQVAESLTRRVKLDGAAEFRQASALEMPFGTAAFEGVYMIHVGMNIQDKGKLFREVARVLKPGGRFAIFDIMGDSSRVFEFPVPWAVTPATSFVATLDEYSQWLSSAGFHIVRQRDRRQFALEWTEKMRAQAASSASPVHGVQVLMSDQMPTMVRNVTAAIATGALKPVELVASLR
jgi:ubiquinone/menaquinone biosynthesis C-methylase UbiE